MMFDVEFHTKLTKAYIDDMYVDTVPSSVGRYTIRVTAHGRVLADAFTHAPDPADAQTLLDLVRVRGAT